MSQTKTTLNDEDDVLVAYRIESFYDTFPQGRIITELVSRADGEITFKASVYRGGSDGSPAATGWAADRESVGGTHTVTSLESTETAAIGRALANLGFTTARRLSSTDVTVKSDEGGRTPSPLGIGTRPPEPPPFPAPRAAHMPDHAGREAIADVLALLETAERNGYSAERSQTVRERLAGGNVPAASLVRVERALRRWLAERAERRG